STSVLCCEILNGTLRKCKKPHDSIEYLLVSTILKLKPLVKVAKARTIQKLVRQIQKLKKVKGSVENVEKARSKAERLLEEIFTIKSLAQDQIAQYALGNTVSFFHISSQVDIPVEIKAMTRVSENPKIQQYVKSFRAEHQDWEKLGDFMLFKQSGRRYKKGVNPNRVERIKASEALVKTYIDKKFAGDKEKIKKAENITDHVLKKNCFNSNVDQTQKIASSIDKKQLQNDKKPKKRKLFAAIASYSDSENSEDKQEDIVNHLKTSADKINKEVELKSIHTSSIPNKSIPQDNASETDNSGNVSSNSDSASESDDNTSLEKETSDKIQIKTKISKQKLSPGIIFSPKSTIKVKATKQKKLKSNKSEKSEKSTTANVPDDDSDEEFVIKKNMEMVVRKINWENFGEGGDLIPLIFKGNKDIKKSRKHKSDFFETSDNEYEEESSNDGMKEETGKKSEVDDVVQSAEVKGYGRTLIESAFVKSLGGTVRKTRPDKISKEKTKMEIQIKRERNSKKSANTQVNVNKQFGRNNKTQNTVIENVHPSWAASIKRKQEQGMIGAFQGKKIKFD
ncbi:serum response factor-binding protein 1, partial [Patella vulgata]|uniref:serum response factor-binding protein 1 n=1 Tax=Patella vulgata TaxID=6465 RepID=UPI0021801103